MMTRLLTMTRGLGTLTRQKVAIGREGQRRRADRSTAEWLLALESMARTCKCQSLGHCSKHWQQQQLQSSAVKAKKEGEKSKFDTWPVANNAVHCGAPQKDHHFGSAVEWSW